MGRQKAEERREKEQERIERPGPGRLVVMGVDPGFAEMGYAVVSSAGPGDFVLEQAGVLSTKKISKAKRCGLRVTNEDVDRHRTLYRQLEEIRRKHEAYAVGVEAYTVDGKRKYGGGSAAKTMAVYGGVIWWALSTGRVIAPFLPQDLKRRFCGTQSAGKDQVAAQACKVVRGLQRALDGVCDSKQEHLGDAACVAVLMLEDVFELRRTVGIC